MQKKKVLKNVKNYNAFMKNNKKESNSLQKVK